jgi:hypothetical protein
MAQWAEFTPASIALSEMAARSAVSKSEIGAQLADQVGLKDLWLIRDRQDLQLRCQIVERGLNESLAASRPAQNLRLEIASVARQIDAIDKKLPNKFARFVALEKPRPVSIDELRRILRSDEVLVQFGIPESEIESRVWLGSRATETNVKELNRKGELATYRVVQFATHGLIAGEVKNLAESALVLTPPAQATEADDGLLTASEVTELKLNADWVVLSACNTPAGSAVNAEALSGLARAFFYAGARALLVSHWQVNSDAAVKLTTGAFTALQANPQIGRAAALQQAMTAMVKSGNDTEVHPSNWAPFILVGEGGAAR